MAVLDYAPLVLVVEDNPANQMLAASLLQREGFQAEVVDCVPEAQRTIDECRPCLILMDIQLPGEDGLSFAQRLKSAPETAQIPVVALTASAMNGDRDRALAAGCVDYISKPIDTRTFGAHIRRILEG